MKKQSIAFALLSQYRASLMGIAIVLIMYCHSTVQVGAAILPYYILTKMFAQIGVDIFLFLSGMGIYYSLNKAPKVFDFYGKRLLKILPSFFLILGIWAVVQVFFNTIGNAWAFLYSYSLVTFYLRGDTNEWFIAAILLLYFVSPLCYRAINGGKKRFTLSVLLVYVISAFCFIAAQMFAHTKFANAFLTVNELLIVRVPLYLAGMYFGKKLNEEKSSSVATWKVWLCFFLGLILFVLNTVIFPENKLWFSQWYLTRAIFGVICIPMLLLICRLLEKVSPNTAKRKLPFALLGTVTLEIYLIHVKTLMVLDKYFTKSVATSVIANLAAVAIAILLAFAVNRISGVIRRKMLPQKGTPSI